MKCFKLKMKNENFFKVNLKKNLVIRINLKLIHSKGKIHLGMSETSNVL